jgi:superfamily II DNA helicase RecQ
MALRNPQFRSLLSRPAWNQDIIILGFDEAHCASQWDSDFRKSYGIVGNARSLLPTGVPVLAVSATMEPLVLAEVRKILHIDADDSFHLNLGNRRDNIKYEVYKIPKDMLDVSQLELVIPKEITDKSSLPKTMIFFDSIDEMLEACEWLRTRCPEVDRSTFAAFHAKMSAQYKTRTLGRFETASDLRVMLATEAAGMVSSSFRCSSRISSI